MSAWGDGVELNQPKVEAWPMVDLSTGRCGIVKMGDGRKFYCMAVSPYNGGKLFSVRIESGYYLDYRKDGVRARPGPRRQDIVEFIPCGMTDPRAKGLPTEIAP